MNMNLRIVQNTGAAVNDPEFTLAPAAPEVAPVSSPAEYTSPFASEEAAQAVACIPNGFALSGEGLTAVVEAGEDEFENIWLCSPLIILGKCRKADSSSWSVLVEFIDPDGKIHREAIPQGQLTKSGAGAFSLLADRGLTISGHPKARKALKEMFSSWRPNSRWTLVDRAGWVDAEYSSFVCQDGRSIGKLPVHPTGDLSGSTRSRSSSRGTLQEWQEGVAALSIGNPAMMAAVSLAFAGPLLAPLNQHGAILHLRGQTSRGKSTICAAAASVWGPSRSMRTWSATAASLEGEAARHNHSLLILDEIGEADPATIGKTVYGLTNGKGRGRATASGGLQATQEWLLPVLSSGEKTLGDIMQSAGRSLAGGQLARFVDISADGRAHGAFDDLHGDTDGGAFSGRIMHAVGRSYGMAGPEFVARLTKSKLSRDGAVENRFKRIRAIIAKIVERAEDPGVQRTLNLLAVIALAGEFSAALRVTPWASGDTLTAVMGLARQWSENRDIPNRDEAGQITERVRKYVAAHMATGFRRLDLTTASDPLDMDWMDNDYFYLRTETWAQIHLGHDRDEAGRELNRLGFLRVSGGDHHQYRMPRNVADRPRVYAVRRSIIS
jgi:putative DNA primase/helicase